MTNRKNPPIILITGATDGIGRALAQQYHATGARLVLIGRRPLHTLDAAIFTPERYCRIDLTQPFAAALVTEFLRKHAIERLDLLIHNAGVGSYGPIAAQSAVSIDVILNTNLSAPIALTHALLEWLIAARGRVVLIGSVAAALPAPEYAVYAASKAALEGFGRSLRVEQRGQIGVQVIHPGATRTSMHQKIGAPLERMGWQRFPSPEHTATHIMHTIEQGPVVATIGMGNQLLRLLGHHTGPIIDWLMSLQKRA
ncbi:MAG: SDR family NAD(P)-dependent oxidoreductase [Roseiflexaceae bacterium]|nr:SDR family NAD(P)-dependent oxidoreductase [Roseiflexaceae bacterium]